MLYIPGMYRVTLYLHESESRRGSVVYVVVVVVVDTLEFESYRVP